MKEILLIVDFGDLFERKRDQVVRQAHKSVVNATVVGSMAAPRN